MARNKRLNFLSADFFSDYLNNPEERVKYFFNNIIESNLDMMTDNRQKRQYGLCMSGRVSKENTGKGLDPSDVKLYEVPDQPEAYTIAIKVWRKTEDNFCVNPFLEKNAANWSKEEALLIENATIEWAESEGVFSSTDLVPEFNDMVMIREDFKTGQLYWQHYSGLSPTTMVGVLGEGSPGMPNFGAGSALMGDMPSCQPGNTGAAYIYPGAVQMCEQYTFVTKVRSKPPTGIIVHYDVGNSGTGTAKYMATQTKLAYHFIVERDGTVLQLVDPSKATNHVISKDETKNNNATIGVSLSNLGYDVKHIRPSLEEARTAGKIMKGPDPRDGKEREWEIYPRAQIQAYHKLVAALKEKYGIKNDRIKGHSEVQPNKADPGPAFFKAGGWSRTR